MNETENPFLLTGSYKGPAFFCDRVDETKLLISNAKNGVNTTLLSRRRMGKTGLIYHAFQLLEKDRKTRCIYVDIFATQDFKQFTNQFATAVLQSFPEKQTIGKKLMQLMKSLRPVISFDGLSGLPEVTFDFTKEKQYEYSISGLLSFLEKQAVKIVIAFDEFQQISQYPEKHIEAFLRTQMQPLKNIRFIFSGSNQHILAQMFNDSKRPFFSSTQSVFLNPITPQNYSTFIKFHFKNHKRKIQDDALEYIIEWTKLHTYYTQALCNKLFAGGNKNISLEIAEQTSKRILIEQENIFYQYRSLLTRIQWNLVIAIAKMDKLYKPTAKSFIKKYDVGTTANVQRALAALLQKEMIYQHKDELGNYYSVYDCFLSRWLELQRI